MCNQMKMFTLAGTSTSRLSSVPSPLLTDDETDEKLIELVRKYEELCDMSNNKYRDRVWKEKLNILD